MLRCHEIHSNLFKPFLVKKVFPNLFRHFLVKNEIRYIFADVDVFEPILILFAPSRPRPPPQKKKLPVPHACPIFVLYRKSGKNRIPDGFPKKWFHLIKFTEIFVSNWSVFDSCSGPPHTESAQDDATKAPPPLYPMRSQIRLPRIGVSMLPRTLSRCVSYDTNRIERCCHKM